MTGDGGAAPSYVHATAIAAGERGILITGPSGAGKSRLALLLVGEACRRGLFARLVGDDRVALVRRGDRIVASGHPAVAGWVERRSDGIVTVPYERACVIDRLVDLVSRERERLPEPAAAWGDILGQRIPRLTLPAGLRNVDCADLLDRLLLRLEPAL